MQESRTSQPNDLRSNAGLEIAGLAVAHGIAGRSPDPLVEEVFAQNRHLQMALDKIPVGVCFFDSDQRLLVANRSYAVIYHLAPDDLKPGMAFEELVEKRFEAGTCPLPPRVYLNWCAKINSDKEPKTWEAALPDGRTIRIDHEPTPGGGWVSSHEDVTELRASRSAVETKLSLQSLIDWVPDYLWVKDKDSRFIVANKAIALDSGKPATADMLGLSDFDLHSVEAAKEFRATEEGILRTGVPMIDREERVVDAAGTQKWLSSTKVPLRNAAGEITGLVGIARDITARKRSDALRSGQAEILEMIATGAPLADVLSSLVQLVEGQLENVVGAAFLVDGTHLRAVAAGDAASEYAHALDGVAIDANTASPVAAAAFRGQTLVVSDITADPLWARARDRAQAHGIRSFWSTPIVSSQDAVLGVLALFSPSPRSPLEPEIGLIKTATRIAGIAIERKLAEEQVNFLAHHDALTGLPNRMLLMDRLGQAILHGQRDGGWAAVVFADLDNFKLINDSLGHNAGDVVLRTVAKRMIDSIRPTDSVVRMGGDEFVIVLADQPNNADAVSAVLERLRAAIAQPIQVGEQSLRVSTSMGIATYPNDGKDPETLLRNADTAMYQAKGLGRDNFQFFTDTMNTQVQGTLSLREDLRVAVERSQFHLVYQPQVDLTSGTVFAVEALLRWQHPTRGMVPPGQFIPLAEESGLIVPLGDWVLREACRQAKAWQDAGLPPIGMCVNVSARQFRDRGWIDRVLGALDASGLEPRYLELELTESLLMQDVDQAIAIMRELQAKGVQFAIDDFGTGYSSLSALKNFPVARLKIDRSFVRSLPENADDRGIAAAVISLGQKLNMRVIAEGVETEAQMDFLRANDCNEIQGYYFSKPVGADELAATLLAPSTGGALVATGRPAPTH